MDWWSKCYWGFLDYCTRGRILLPDLSSTQFFSSSDSKFDELQLIKFLNFWLLIQILAPTLDLKPLDFLTIESFGPYFILGASLSQMSSIKKVKRYFLILAVSFILTAKHVQERVPDMQFGLFFAALLMIIVVLLILLSNSEEAFKISNRTSRLIKMLSLMTYPIYLLHETFGLSLVSLLNRSGIDVRMCFLISSVVVVSLSWLSVKFFEPVSRSVIKKFFPSNARGAH